MSLPEYSLKNRKVVWFFLFVLLAGGALGFVTLGKKEDSVFVIKSASLVCSYPGATPLEVEQLVTEPIEREVQSMRRVHKITSESYYGLSKIQVELDPATPAAEIPQLWDELRRKVLNVQPKLPAGASQITVADDFGDVCDAAVVPHERVEDLDARGVAEDLEQVGEVVEKLLVGKVLGRAGGGDRGFGGLDVGFRFINADAHCNILSYEHALI